MPDCTLAGLCTETADVVHQVGYYFSRSVWRKMFERLFKSQYAPTLSVSLRDLMKFEIWKYADEPFQKFDMLASRLCDRHWKCIDKGFQGHFLRGTSLGAIMGEQLIYQRMLKSESIETI